MPDCKTSALFGHCCVRNPDHNYYQDHSADTDELAAAVLAAAMTIDLVIPLLNMKLSAFKLCFFQNANQVLAPLQIRRSYSTG
jgi:hypothetical protein